MRYKLKGNWKKGLAVDLHTLASTYLGPNEYGHPQFDNTYSDMGKLVHRLKYDHDKSAIPEIIALLEPITGIENLDAIIPVPSSKARAKQPVDQIAKALGAQRGVPVLKGYLTKTGGAELKGIDDPAERAEALAGTITITGKQDISGQRVLLLDDLYRSGATLNACCSVLLKQAGIESVSVLTMTKTRSNR